MRGSSRGGEGRLPQDLRKGIAAERLRRSRPSRCAGCAGRGEPGEIPLRGPLRPPGGESAFRADQNHRVPRRVGRQGLGQGTALLLPQHQAQLLTTGGKSLRERKGGVKARQDRSPALPAGLPDDPPPALKPFPFALFFREGNGATGQQGGKGGNPQFRAFLKDKVHLVPLGQRLQKMYREGGFLFPPSPQDDRPARAPAQGLDAGPADRSAAVQKEDLLSGFEAQDCEVVENLLAEGVRDPGSEPREG